MDLKLTQGLKNSFGLVIGIFVDIVGLREIFTRENRDVLVDVIGSVISLHSIYLGVIVCATILTIFFGWNLSKHRCPSSRFRSQSELISCAMSRFITDFNPGSISIDTLTPPTKATMNELIYILSDFKIPHPGRSAGELSFWKEFLPRLLAASRTGKVKEARSIWPKMKN